LQSPFHQTSVRRNVNFIRAIEATAGLSETGTLLVYRSIGRK
jgi:hypothetical protein